MRLLCCGARLGHEVRVQLHESSGDIGCPGVVHEHAEDIEALPSAHAHKADPTCRGVIEGLMQSTLNDRKPFAQRRALVPVLTMPSDPVPSPVHLLRVQTQSGVRL